MSQGKQPAKAEQEDVVDAMGGGTTAVATAQTTAVSAETVVQGVQLDFPFIRPDRA